MAEILADIGILISGLFILRYALKVVRAKRWSLRRTDRLIRYIDAVNAILRP